MQTVATYGTTSVINACTITVAAVRVFPLQKLIAGSVESLSHNSNLVGRGRRYSGRGVQMRIADLVREIQGRCNKRELRRHGGVAMAS